MSTLPVDPSSIASQASERPTIVVRPRRGWQAIDLRELWRFRDLLWQLTVRDVSVRYKQAVLGVLWAIIQPVTNMVVLTVFFGWVMGLSDKMQSLPDGRKIPFAVFVLSGQVFWEFFAGAVLASSGSMVGNAGLLQKVYLPRLILPFSAVGAPMVDFVIAFTVLMLVMIGYALPMSVELLLLPLFMASVVVAALGVGVLLSALTVAYRDFRFVVPFLVRTWFFATPVVWQLEMVPERFRFWMYLNPMVGPIEAYRGAMFGMEIGWAGWGVSTAVGLLACVIGLLYFARVERHFADIA